MITSLHSPHVEVVKALLGSRGVKERRERGQYVIEGASNLRAALDNAADSVTKIYYTSDGLTRFGQITSDVELIEVSPQVMKAMSDTVSSQGVLALAQIPERSLAKFITEAKPTRIAYFWQIQDPGNAGTVIRAADAFGFDAVIFSDSSVDIYSPKVVRATAGSLWQIPVFEECAIAELAKLAGEFHGELLVTKADGEETLATAARRVAGKLSFWVFGNEARGIPAEVERELQPRSVRIPMSGRAESLNLATAAAVVMYASEADQ